MAQHKLSHSKRGEREIETSETKANSKFSRTDLKAYIAPCPTFRASCGEISTPKVLRGLGLT